MSEKTAKQIIVTVCEDGFRAQQACKCKSSLLLRQNKECSTLSTLHASVRSHVITIVLAALVVLFAVYISLEIRSIKIELNEQKAIVKNHQNKIDLLIVHLQRFQDEEKQEKEQGPEFEIAEEEHVIKEKYEQVPSRKRRSVIESPKQEESSSRKGGGRKRRCGKSRHRKRKCQGYLEALANYTQATEIMHLKGNGIEIKTDNTASPKTLFQNWNPEYLTGKNIYREGWIHIQTTGYYYVYCQVTYQGTYHAANYGLIFENGDKLNSRVAVAVPSNNQNQTEKIQVERTKYTGKLMKLKYGQKISVTHIQYNGEQITYGMRADSSFFGLYIVSRNATS